MHKHSKLLPIVIWSLSAIFYFYDNLIQVTPSVIKPELTAAFAISAEQFGTLSAYFLWAYGLMQIPVGLLIDRFGPRKLLIIATALAAIGCFIFGGAETILQAKLARILMGIGAGFAVVSCLKISSIWFSPSRFAFLTGAMVTVGFLGQITNHVIFSYSLAVLDWRKLIFICGVVGLIILGLIILFVKDREDHSGKTVSAPSFSNLITGLKKVVVQPQVWIASIYSGLMFVPTIAFGGLWGVPFLTEAYGFERQVAGEIVSWIYVGWIFGAPFFGWFSDFINRRNIPMHVSTLVTLGLSIVLVYWTGLNPIALKIILFAIGFFSSGFILSFAVVREINPPLLAGTVIGFLNTINTFSGALSQQVIGSILDWGTGPQEVSRVFTLPEYQFALLSMPVCLLLSFVLLLFLKETYCKQV